MRTHAGPEPLSGIRSVQHAHAHRWVRAAVGSAVAMGATGYIDTTARILKMGVWCSGSYGCYQVD